MTLESERTKCALRLLRIRYLDPPLLGLKFTSDGFKIDEEAFHCCHGQGRYFCKDRNAVYACDLKQRFSRIDRLIRQYVKTWGPSREQALICFTSEQNLKMAGSFISFVKKKDQFGLKEVVKSRDQPSHQWLMACTCIWRLGLDIHLVSIGKTHFNDYLPRENKKVDIIFVEHIDKLYDSTIAFEFERIVSYAYHARIKLVLLFSGKKVSPASPKAGFFSQKISNLKNRSPDAFLAEDCLSKLGGMGVEI